MSDKIFFAAYRCTDDGESYYELRFLKATTTADAAGSPVRLRGKPHALQEAHDLPSYGAADFEHVASVEIYSWVLDAESLVAQPLGVTNYGESISVFTDAVQAAV